MEYNCIHIYVYCTIMCNSICENNLKIIQFLFIFQLNLHFQINQV